MSKLFNLLWELVFWAFMLGIIAFVGGSYFEIPPFQTDGPVHRWVSTHSGGVIFTPGGTRNAPTERISLGSGGDKTFKWENINSAGISNKSKASFQMAGNADRFELSVDIDLEALKSVVNRFGPPKTAGVFMIPPGTDSKSWFARYGFVQSDHLLPDYNWLVTESTESTRQLNQDLEELASRRGYDTAREKVGLTASFVQHALPYRIPEDEREDFNGTVRSIAGILPPLEVLHRGWGDCDSKSVLFATLLKQVPRQDVVLIHGHGHMFVGFRATPRHGEAHISVRGDNYVLIEMTNPTPLGIISPTFLQALQKRELHIVPIHCATSLANAPRGSKGTKKKRKGKKKRKDKGKRRG